ncbi:MAG: hypothetical protein V3U45_03825 [bacterium]
MFLRMNGLGQPNGFFSPEDQARIDEARYQAGQVYEAGEGVYQSGRKIYDVIPPSWRPVILGMVIGWWLRGR